MDIKKVGKKNTVDKISQLVGSAASPMLRIDNNGTGTALQLLVEPASKKPPMTVNSDVRVPKLNADRLDGKHASGFYAAGSKVADSDALDGKDAGEFMQNGSAAGGDLSGNYPNPNIANNAVTSAKIQDGQVQNADIANDAVNSAKIANDQVSGADIDETEVQRRVSSFCPSGSSIRSVSQTGTVVCDTDGITGYQVVTNSSAYNDIGFKSVEVLCPLNKVAMTGGARYSNSATLIVRSDTDGIAIQSDGGFSQNVWVQNAWTVEAGYVGSASPPTWRLIVYAVCINQ